MKPPLGGEKQTQTNPNKPNLPRIKMNAFARKRSFTMMVVNSTRGIYHPIRVPISLEFRSQKVYGFFVGNNSCSKWL